MIVRIYLSNGGHTCTSYMDIADLSKTAPINIF